MLVLLLWKRTAAAAALSALAALAPAQVWEPLSSGTAASLRGVSAVTGRIAWASGAGGTFLSTTDGRNWAARTMPGAANLDFRDVEAFDQRTAFLLSSGDGPLSRIYKTTNGGQSWLLLHTNPDPRGFLDCMAFWDQTHGIVLGDPVGGRFAILTTSDGLRWEPRPGPRANPGETAFAASGSCIHARGTREVWFGTGGRGGARVFHSTDGGQTWTAAPTPIRRDAESAGIFSLAFSGLRGIAVGGDSARSDQVAGNLAISEDGGRTWSAPQGAPPGGYRSAVAFAGGTWIATGPNGSDVSADGRTWTRLAGGYHALSLIGADAESRRGFAVGPNGAIGAFRVLLE
jgi:photosystem II stability/assembly factor-like uncharacterized protein